MFFEIRHVRKFSILFYKKFPCSHVSCTLTSVAQAPQSFICDESINDLHPITISQIQTPGGSGNTGNFLSTTRYETLDDVRSRLFNLKLQNNRYYTVELPNICHTPLCKHFFESPSSYFSQFLLL